MTTEMPMWWLVVSAIFFVVEILFLGCLIVAVLRLMQAVKEISPKVEAISVKVHEIGDKVEDLTSNVKDTMESIGSRAKSVAGSADLIAHTAAHTFERFSPAVVGVLSGLKILKAVMELRSDRKAAAARRALVEEKRTATELAKVDKRAKK